MLEYIGFKDLIDLQDFTKLVFRFSLNIIMATLVINGMYKRLYARSEYVFTYFVFNTITFTLCFLLRKVPIELGFALGLFAVFGILRYRTEPIGIRDLTYMFIVIGIGILNAVTNKKVSLAELLFVNGAIVTITALLEWFPRHAREHTHVVTYDNLELLRSDDQQPLLADLSERTGLKVIRVNVRQYDLLRDTAELTIFYRKEAA